MQLGFQAWNLKTFKKFEVNDKLKASLKLVDIGEIIEMNLIGDSKYIMMTIKKKKQKEDGEEFSFL